MDAGHDARGRPRSRLQADHHRPMQRGRAHATRSSASSTATRRSRTTPAPPPPVSGVLGVISGRRACVACWWPTCSRWPRASDRSSRRSRMSKGPCPAHCRGSRRSPLRPAMRGHRRLLQAASVFGHMNDGMPSPVDFEARLQELNEAGVQETRGTSLGPCIEDHGEPAPGGTGFPERGARRAVPSRPSADVLPANRRREPRRRATRPPGG